MEIFLNEMCKQVLTNLFKVNFLKHIFRCMFYIPYKTNMVRLLSASLEYLDILHRIIK